MNRIVLLTALLLTVCPGPATAIHDATLPFSFRFAACRDDAVARFVGKPSREVLSEVKGMNLRAFRLVNYASPVNFEVVPERLTLVVDDFAVIARAFCR